MSNVGQAAMSRPPVGRAFVGFVVAVVLVLALLVAGRGPSVPAATATELGVMAVTLFGAAGVLCLYRAAVANDLMAALIAVLLLLGAMWSWLAFVGTSGAAESAAPLAGVGGAIGAVVLLVRGFRSARWLEVFSGLGLLAVALSGGFLHAGVEAGSSISTVAMLAALAGMTSLYGLLVDIELAGHRSSQQLLETTLQMETESRRMSDLLHDLHNGLLSIEAASGASASSDADPVRCEAARLRRLTIPGALEPETFDLVCGVVHLVAAKRAAGVNVVAHLPPTVIVEGVEAELLSVVENLLSNAQRHGRSPIIVELTDDDSEVRLTVSDSGDGVSALDLDRVFRRGFTSHPDGRGLGLCRARQLARQNDADLRLDTGGGGGGGGARFVLIMTSSAGVGV